MANRHTVLAWWIGLALAVTAFALSMDETFAQGPPKVEIVPQIPHAGSVNSVAFSPDGTRVLSGSAEDNTLKLWDTSTGALIRTFEGHAFFVISVAFSPDGTRLLSGSWDNTLKLWDASTGALIRTFDGHPNWVNSASFSPDGRHVLSGSWDKTLKLWDAATGALIRTFEGHTDGVESAAFSRDGARVLSGSRDKTLKLWDAATGALIRNFEGHTGRVNSVAFSPDGARVLSGSQDKTLKLWDAATGALIRTVEGHADGVNAVAFSPEGTHMLSGSDDDSLKLWDATGALIRTLEGHSDRVVSVAFSPDGARVLSGSRDKTLKLWDAATGALIRSFQGHSERVNAVAISPDGALMLSGSVDKTLKLWDATTGALIRTLRGHSRPIMSVAFSADGARVLSGSTDKTLKLWDATTGALMRTFAGHSGSVHSVAFSPDGTRALSGSRDKTLKLWDAATGALIRTFEGHSDYVYSVAFSPDGTRVLSGSTDDTLKLWDAATGTLIRTFEGHSGAVRSVAFSPEGSRVLSGSTDKTLKLWDAATGNLIRTFSGKDIVWSVAFSRDGARVLSGHLDKTLGLWNTATGALIRTVEGHSGYVLSVAFSPDGARLLSGSADTTVRVWNAENGEPLTTSIAGRKQEWLTITPRGFFVASQKDGEILALVRGYEVISIAQVYQHLYRPDLVEELLKGDPEDKHHNAAAELDLQRIYDSGPPPQLELLPRRTERDGDLFKFAVRITDIGGGIGAEVWWRVNGKSRGNITVPGLAGPPSPGRYVVMPQELRLDLEQKNEIEVIAFNNYKGRSLRASPPLKVATVDKLGVTTGERPHLYVLSIGIDTYPRANWRLTYAKHDATAIADALKVVGSAAFLPENIHLISLLDAQATEREIASTFHRLAKAVQPRDVFILFVAGHGRSRAGSGWYFLPADFNEDKLEDKGIGLQKWLTWLRGINANKTWLILDSCESGAGTARRGSDTERQAVIGQMEHASGHSILSAAPEGKVAYETSRLGHGLLTYTILEAMNRPADVAAEQISVFGIAAHVSRRVPEISEKEFLERQKPKFEPSGDDFPLGFTAAVIKDRGPAPKSAIITREITARKAATAEAPIMLTLKPGNPIKVKREEAGWALIEKDGREIGFVPSDAYLIIQPN